MQRKKFTGEFKSKIALEAIREQKTINEIASKYEVYPNQVSTWKRELLERIEGIFSDKRSKENKPDEDLVPQLYQQIGQLKVEVDWLKKKSGIKS
jgi:transposase-like protein